MIFFFFNNLCVPALGPIGLWVTIALIMSSLHTMMLSVQDLWDQQLRMILTEIAQDHQLDRRQLIGKYILRGMPDLSPKTLETYPEAQKPLAQESQKPPEIPEPRVAQAPPPRKKGGRKPKFQEKPNLEGELTEEYLRGLTIPLIKEACKMRKIAMGGGKNVLIERFLEYQENPGAHRPPRKGGRKKKSQEPEPCHNHSLDGKIHEDCQQCKMYGNPDDPKMEEEEFEIDQDIQNKLKEIVGTMNEPKETGEFEIAQDIQNHLKETEETEEPSDDEAGWDEYQEPQDEDDDPFDVMEYGDELTFEE